MPSKTVKGRKRFVDISDIEKKLEDGRTEDRLGRVATTTSAALFFTDVAGSASVKKTLKTLRMDEILKPSSKIPGLVRKVKNTAVPVAGVKNRNISKNIKMKIKTMGETKKALGLGIGSSALESRQKLILKKQEKDRSIGGFNLWDTPDPIPNPLFEDFIQKKVKRRSTVDMRPKAIPAVIIPHAGASYNPDPEMHRDAINKAAKPEFEKMDRQEHIKMQLSYPPELDAMDDFNDVPVENSADEQEEEEEEVEVESIPTKTSKRKTQADRNRRDRAIQAAHIEKQARVQKNLMKQINSLSALKTEHLLTRESHLSTLSLRSSTALHKSLHSTMKLGRHAFKPTPIAIQLPDEIAATIRELKPEGSSLLDRFRSLQQRNVIETRVPVKRRRKYGRAPREVQSHDYKRFK